MHCITLDLLIQWYKWNVQCITLEGWTDMLYWVHDAQGNLGMASELLQKYFTFPDHDDSSLCMQASISSPWSSLGRSSSWTLSLVSSLESSPRWLSLSPSPMLPFKICLLFDIFLLLLHQEREKSQSRGDFQKMRAKQQMDEDLQGYQVSEISTWTIGIHESPWPYKWYRWYTLLNTS